ncbi:YgaP family membrane protein [Flavobacterium lacisediminis]|jgi:hypothetical protein|uniref:DUF2892 domain-containing protein n=1 Tax=Flavobacterium lacisediminis TaxID=2989705 RepID=A0ABT3EIL7_9FLAO|nr:DUF2892 domain-containing protein [Flavobacterium lacisediminis]MCW1148407.1 DUF2892 domain-containing protein [Flavobacterium lacisediminis]
MKKNVGTGDRFLRVMIGVIALILGLSGMLDGTLKWVVLGVGAIMVLTASMQFCPLYTLLGINTCKVKPKK